MGADFVARGLAGRSLRHQGPHAADFGFSTDASEQANRIAFRDAFAAGAKELALAPGRFACGTIPADEEVVNQTPYQQPAVILPEGFRRLDGRGAKLVLYDGRGIKAESWMNWAFPTTMSYLAADVAAGDVTVTLEPGEGAKWSAGDTALWRFGSFYYDVPECPDWGFAQVRAVDGDRVTLDRPLPAPFAVASVADQAFTSNLGTEWYNKALHKWPLFDDLEIVDLSCDTIDDAWAEEFITVRGGRRLAIRRCGAAKVGIGFSLQYVEGAVIEDCWAEDAATFSPAIGKAISLAETRDVEIRNFRARGVRRFAALEAGSEARLVGGLFENTGVPATGASYGTDCIVFGVLSRSKLSVRDFTITGYGGYVLTGTKNGDSADDGTVRFDGRLTLIHPAEPYGIDLDQIGGLLDYRIAGGRELWDFANRRTWRRRIYLKNGQFQNFRGPRGALVRMRVYASPALTFGAGKKLSAFYIGREGTNGADYAGSLVAGTDTTLTFLGGVAAGPFWTRRAEQLRILLSTESGTSLNAADQYLDIECEFAIDRLAPDSAWLLDADERNAGPGGALREALFPAYDIPAIAAGATVTIDFAIPAMSSGDLVHTVDYAGNLGGVTIRQVETITGAARVVFENQTGAALDTVPSDIRVAWSKSLTSG
jgi:hypothetical protein